MCCKGSNHRAFSMNSRTSPPMSHAARPAPPTNAPSPRNWRSIQARSRGDRQKSGRSGLASVYDHESDAHDQGKYQQQAEDYAKGCDPFIHEDDTANEGSARLELLESTAGPGRLADLSGRGIR